MSTQKHLAQGLSANSDTVSRQLENIGHETTHQTTTQGALRESLKAEGVVYSFGINMDKPTKYKKG